jgi:hypothetical protein
MGSHGNRKDRDEPNVAALVGRQEHTAGDEKHGDHSIVHERSIQGKHGVRRIFTLILQTLLIHDGGTDDQAQHKDQRSAKEGVSG